MKNGDTWRSENNLQIGIIGNLENRRVRDFSSTAITLGYPTPHCVGWLEFIDHPERGLSQLESMDLIRIDSPGENADVQHRLIQSGNDPNRIAHGELAGVSDHHFGFCQQLDRLETLNTPFQNTPSDIKAMFDKWASHQRFVEANVRRPETCLLPESVDAFRAKLQSSSPLPHRLFLKPRFGSSACGVCAYRWNDDREQLIAPIEIESRDGVVRLFNSLQVRAYTHRHDIDLILNRLLPEGMVCEHWIPKARLDEGNFDLRVLVVSGEARHVIGRKSHHPMTNLHLGNQRADLAEVIRAVGEQTVYQSLRLAESAAACFPSSLYAGVDVLISSSGESLICEINAFGDLLPNATHRGETAYEAILKASHVFSHPV